MKIRFLLLIALIPSLAFAAVREDSDVIIKSAERYYEVKYKNGGIDRFVYVFSAHLKSFMKQDGASSSWTHPTDTRRCTYTVSSYIQREGFFITGGGQRVSLDSVNKVYGPGTWRRRTNDVFENIIGKHSPCNDYINDFNGIKSSIKSQILRDFDVLLLKDIVPESESDAKNAISEIKAFNYREK